MKWTLPFSPYLLIVFVAVLVILIVVLIIVIYNSTHFVVKANKYDELDEKLTNDRKNGGNMLAKYKVILTNVKNSTDVYTCGMDTKIIVGSSESRSNLVIDNDEGISRRHCEIGIVDGGYYIRDLNSKNGTFVNTKRITDAIVIKSGVHIRIGMSEYELKIIHN